ncbi:MAG: hypothetical protein KDE33_17205, partial [Bacteroidetes bacterium]|nr:hypothetical protein [Bacteroidota bacterium]
HLICSFFWFFIVRFYKSNNDWINPITANTINAIPIILQAIVTKNCGVFFLYFRLLYIKRGKTIQMKSPIKTFIIAAAIP